MRQHISPRIPNIEGYHPMFLRALKHNDYYYISKISLEQEEQACLLREKIVFEKWLEKNNLEIVKMKKTDMHRIQKVV
jgi:hypothetical protein